MILKLRIKPDSSENKFIESENLVQVKASATKNKANMELIKTLAKHYKVSSSQIKIIKGLSSREKIIEIQEKR
ncbi:MAG: DUF167 domain-containing protein [Candidatus Pacearchaeota archaeon]